MPLLFLEFIGTTELMVIALVALIIFGPRKLPELGRTLGKSLGEFKRASEDFKRTWEREVEIERTIKETRIDDAILTDTVVASPALPVEDGGVAPEASAATIPRTSSPSNAGHDALNAGHDTSLAPSAAAPVAADADPAAQPGGKQDWL